MTPPQIQLLLAVLDQLVLLSDADHSNVDRALSRLKESLEVNEAAWVGWRNAPDNIPVKDFVKDLGGAVWGTTKSGGTSCISEIGYERLCRSNPNLVPYENLPQEVAK